MQQYGILNKASLNTNIIKFTFNSTMNLLVCISRDARSRNKSIFTLMTPPRHLRTFWWVMPYLRCRIWNSHTKLSARAKSIYADRMSRKTPLICTTAKISTPSIPSYGEKRKYSNQNAKSQTSTDPNNNQISFMNHSVVSLEIQAMLSSWFFHSQGWMTKMLNQ